jgi:hypothetical protein
LHGIITQAQAAETLGMASARRKQAAWAMDPALSASLSSSFPRSFSLPPSHSLSSPPPFPPPLYFPSFPSLSDLLPPPTSPSPIPPPPSHLDEGQQALRELPVLLVHRHRPAPHRLLRASAVVRTSLCLLLCLRLSGRIPTNNVRATMIVRNHTLHSEFALTSSRFLQQDQPTKTPEASVVPDRLPPEKGGLN